jgi:hypothetical protein
MALSDVVAGEATPEAGSRVCPLMSHRVCAPSRRVFLAFTAASLAACGRSGAGGSGQAAGQRVADPVARRFYELRGGRTVWDQASAQKLAQITTGARAHGLDPAAFAPSGCRASRTTKP